MSAIKQDMKQWIKDHQEQAIRLSSELLCVPELGFKEFKTKQIILEYLRQFNIEVDQEFSLTGFSISLGSGKHHIGLMAELDALVVIDHPDADPISHAAHACGHSTQVVNMVQAFIALKQCHVIDDKDVKLTLFFTPAEEFVDLDARRLLMQEGKIRALSGKQDMLVNGVLDDVDAVIHMHAMINTQCDYSVQSTLGGFVAKEYHFLGKAAHAAVAPHLGINALNAYNLFQTAVALYRETLNENDMVRIHGIVKQGGETINSIPAHVIYESYIRSVNSLSLLTLSKQLTHTAMHCAQALQATCEVKDTAGYLPLVQSAELTAVLYQNLLDVCAPARILTGERSVASGDIGDVACFIPTIQFGYSGFKGTFHGKDFMINDPFYAVIEPAMVVASTVFDLIEDPTAVSDIKEKYNPTITMNEYLIYLRGAGDCE